MIFFRCCEAELALAGGQHELFEFLERHHFLLQQPQQHRNQLGTAEAIANNICCHFLVANLVSAFCYRNVVQSKEMSSSGENLVELFLFL